MGIYEPVDLLPFGSRLRHTKKITTGIYEPVD